MARRQWLYGLGLSTLVMLATGCIVDEDKPCGANEVRLNDNGFIGCICAPDSVPTADGTGCSPCGSHEEAKGGACVCVAGYQRKSASTACEPKSEAGDDSDAGGDTPAKTGPTGENAPCSGPADCANYDATYCQMLQAPNVCLVQGCETGEHSCAGGRVCCSFKDFALLASTGGLCVPMESCIAPGKVVTP
jgi:hypothetical protein